ncbi:MmgE/PrpD family protein [Paraburkholderia unamae]|uniref:MmgE/PrpD family protein n=1 Tax=Paraburkholderia unamae TaxID=219649 RepID=UPI001CAFE4D6|nr:MmgE/PrpD family protein [Paraburkholderia unamae]CAG9272960.1 MmgE/PrpD family protein [Paraburkholderia unamae]
MDLAYEFASSATSRNFTDLAPPTVDATIDALIDSLACALAGTNAPGLAQARGALSRWGDTGCTVWGGFGNAPAPIAAFLNGGSMHALDYDDTDDKVPLHANSVVLPALLADMEESQANCSGHSFLAALAVGLDGAMRVGRAGGPKGSRGWNYSVISGGIGAVLAIANLRRWDTDMTVSALGHQLAQTAGSLQSIIDGCLAKRFQPAMMAKNVLMAAALAQEKIDGPRNVFDGKAGFIRLYQDDQFDRELIEPGLERCSLVVDLSLKPYPACRFTHAPIDLALQMHARGIRPGDIRHLRIQVSGQAVNMVGRHFESETANVVDAQFSIAYCVARALERGALRLEDFSEASVHDERVGRFAANHIAIEVNDKVPFLGMVPVSFDVQLANGQHLEFRADEVSGSPAKRMTPAQLHAKVADCLSFNGVRFSADELISTVRQLRMDAPVSKVLALLA